MPFSHEEKIICPNCNEEQIASVEHTQPFDTKVHECTHCGFVITESEWKEVEQVTFSDEQKERLIKFSKECRKNAGLPLEEMKGCAQ